METSAPDAPARRRFLLYLLALGGAAWLSATRFDPRFRRRGNEPTQPLDRADRAIAGMASGFVRSNPIAARRIARKVSARLSRADRVLPPARRVAAARSLLLRADRIDAEFMAVDVMSLDGWIMARSESEFAIYAHVEGCS